MEKNSMQAKSYTRKAPARKIRCSKIGAARQAVAEFDKGMATYILTFGQFSLIETLEAVLEKTGPAHIAIGTWTAAAADLDRACEFIKSDLIRSIRFVIDRSFINRQPGFAQSLIKRFGIDAIRTTKTHAKFITIKNESWNVVIQTSMNLNENPRLENIDIVDDVEFCDFMNSVVDGIFAEESEGIYGDKGVPALDNIADMFLATPVAMDRGTVTMGVAKI